MLTHQAGAGGDVDVRLVLEPGDVDLGIVAQSDLTTTRAPHLLVGGIATLDDLVDTDLGDAGGGGAARVGRDGVVEARVLLAVDQHGGRGHRHADDGALVAG